MGKRRNDKKKAQQALLSPVHEIERKIRQPIKPKGNKQQELLDALNDPEIYFIFVNGPTRTGKTFLPAATAIDMLDAGTLKNVVFTRPCVTMDEDVGFLPGSKEAKFDPYVLPFINAMKERMGDSELVNEMKANGSIRTHLVAFMRSMTFRDAFVICDESQNLTEKQAESVSTRLVIEPECKSKMIFCGDWKSQCDIRGKSGLKFLIETIGQKPYAKVIEFTTADIYYPIIRDIVETFERYKESRNNNESS